MASANTVRKYRETRQQVYPIPTYTKSQLMTLAKVFNVFFKSGTGCSIEEVEALNAIAGGLRKQAAAEDIYREFVLACSDGLTEEGRALRWYKKLFARWFGKV